MLCHAIHASHQFQRCGKPSMTVAVVPHTLSIMIAVFPKGYICGLHGLTPQLHYLFPTYP